MRETISGYDLLWHPRICIWPASNRFRASGRGTPSPHRSSHDTDRGSPKLSTDGSITARKVPRGLSSYCSRPYPQLHPRSFPRKGTDTIASCHETVRIAVLLARSLPGIHVLPDRLHLVPIVLGFRTITMEYVGTQLQVPEDVPGPSEIVLGPHERYIVIYPHPPVAMRPDECIVRCVLSHMCVTNPRPLESSILVLSIEYALLLNTIVAPFGSIGRTYFSVSSKYVTSRMFPHSRSIP